MQNQNLFFNILTFDWPAEDQTFYFSLEDAPYVKRLHRSQFPNEIEEIFPGISTDGTEFIYTSFDGVEEGFVPLLIDFRNENADLIKSYYNDKIYSYFKFGLRQVVHTGFINETIVWLPVDKSNFFFIYERISLKIQLCTVSDFPEIVISYEGRAKVMNKPVEILIRDIPAEKFFYVLQGRSIFQYKKMSGFEEADYGTAYPLVSNELAKYLNIEVETPPKENKYIKYLRKIENFIEEFINTDAFKEVFPLQNSEFLKVAPGRVNYTIDESNDLLFGNNRKGRVPKTDIRKLKPYKNTPYSNIHLFFIFHKEDKDIVFTLKSYFENGYKWFAGLYDFAGILFHTEKNFSIAFTDKNNPLFEIEEGLNQRRLNPDVKYFAIYITPISKFDQDKEKRIIYYRVKEMLLKRNISSQAIDGKKVIDLATDYVYSLPNIAVAMLAKLDGIPWRLNVPVKNELIVGVGAFRNVQQDVQYIGSAFSFNNVGNFNSFDYFMRHQTDLLAGCIAAKVREYATVNNPPGRLIIHFYKTLGRKELQPIERALQNLELPGKLPIYIISINKTEAEDIVAFDKGCHDLMPVSGTYINIGKSKYLLYNNTNYPGSSVSKVDGFPFPVKLAIDCTDKSKLNDVKIINELINQVYQFSRMYWKSVKQQNLPVTIKYPEMVAQIAPHFESPGIPYYGKDNLWFL